jgi:putative hemolysin
MSKKALHIDVRELFAKKNPRMAAILPGFVYRWIEKIIHQKDINRVLKETVDLKNNAFTEYIIKTEIKARIETKGLENIPATGGAIMVSNHPLGGLDGMVLMLVASEVRQDVRVIVNDLLAEIPNYDEVFIPVNKIGKKAKQSLQNVEEAYSSGGMIMVFPAGLCSRMVNGKITDLTWQKSFISRSLKYRLPVIPVHFSGRNSKRFYRVANFRKFLGLKVNIEMFFLVDELYRQRGKKFSIHIGPPILPETFDQKHSQAAWAEIVKQYVYSLKDSPENHFETFLKNNSSY